MGNEPLALRSEISVDPLVDVALVLLIILILTMMASHEFYRLDQPSGRCGGPLPAVIVVEQINKETIYLNHEFVPMGHLSGRLRNWIKKWPSGIVLYSGTNEITYGTAIQTLDLIRNSGTERIGIVRDYP